MSIIVKDPAFMKQFNRDPRAIAIQYHYQQEEYIMFDKGSEIDESIFLLTVQGFTFDKIHLVDNPFPLRLVCMTHEDENRLPELDRVGFQFGYIFSGICTGIKSECSVCKTPTNTYCKGCERMMYCSRECQLNDRQRHKKFCLPPTKPAPPLASAIPAPVVYTPSPETFTTKIINVPEKFRIACARAKNLLHLCAGCGEELDDNYITVPSTVKETGEIINLHLHLKCFD